MSRFAELLEKYQDSVVTAEESDELARFLKEDEGQARAFYDEVLLEVDLYESYSGIARIQVAPRQSRRWRLPQLTLAFAVAVFVLIGLVALLFSGPPKLPAAVPLPPPAAPTKVLPPTPAPEPKPRYKREKEEHEEHPEHEEREHGSKAAEIEREYQKGLREVERKRAEGKTGEADEKLREIQRERDKKLKSLDRRGEDR